MDAEFWVLHDYGFSDGWQIVAKCSGIYEAVMAREKDVQSGGGTSVIVEKLDTLDAYRRAEYHRSTTALPDPPKDGQ